MSKSHNLNRALLTVSAIILAVGFFALISASAVVGEQEHGDVYYFVKRQLLFGLLVGLVLFFFASKINYRVLARWSSVLLIINVILLLLCFVPAFQSGGSASRRWLQVSFVSVQPSEFIKITYILFLAALLSRFSWEKRRKISWAPFVLFLGSLGAIGFIILKQPATGTLAVLGIASIAVYFSAGMTWTQFFTAAVLSVSVLTLFIKNTAYRLGRVFVSFLSPESDPLGGGYHIIQSLIGIGSGGLFGLGFGHSIQKFNYLPESHTDAIFSIIAEEFGFLGSLVILVLFILFISIGLKIAKRAPDNLGKFLAVGITCLIGAQAFINIASMCQIVPMTGIPLPLISYGGSSMAATILGIGILSNIAKQT